MFTNTFVKKVTILLITSVIVKCYSVETQNQWVRNTKPSGYGTNNVADDLSETIERISGTDNIYSRVGTLSETWNACPDDDELLRNASITCHGVKIVRRVMAQLLDSPRNFQLADGVQLVKLAGLSSDSETSRSMQEDDNGFMKKLQKFLKNHELRIRLPDLLPSSEEWSQYIQQFGGQDGTVKDGSTARRRNKGGGGQGLLALALMMKGLLTALGLGGLGLLAMKALMVSAMALLLSAVIGIKKLASKDDDHGGGHVVSVVPVHSGGDHGHYRKKREIDDAAWLAYRGYKQLFLQS